MATTPKRMRAVIFAGGVGTRMWPMSRKSSPKQFEPMIEGKSTLQLTVKRLLPDFSPQDIYISSGEVYRSIIVNQLPQIPPENIIGEPVMRDVAPAVGYLMTVLAKQDPDTPTAILWSDHLVKEVDTFKQVLFVGAACLEKNPNQFIFIGQKPRFANQNLGWIEHGDTVSTIDGFSIQSFVNWHYRPDQATAKAYFSDGKHAWNPGYFVVTPGFVLKQFKTHMPTMHQQLMTIQQALGTSQQQEIINTVYPQMEKISFDDAVVTKTSPKQALVIAADLGWADIGTWEALKEAVLSDPQSNLESGDVSTYQSTNNILYSRTNQMIAAIGLTEMTVVVTDDVVMVVPQSHIPDIKKLLAEFEGTAKERYT